MWEMKQEKPKRCQIRDEELDEFFEEHGSEDSKRPWDTEEWEKKRNEAIGDECEWCGSSGELVIHHEKHEDAEWWDVWDKTRNMLFEESELYEELDTPKLDCCPECGMRSFYSRETMEPEYRCQKCDHEFNEPDEMEGNVRKMDEYWEAMDSYVEENGAKITEEFEKAYEEYWDSYFEMDGTVTVCKSCHFAWHENGQRLCANCGEEYADYRKDIDEYVCWDCVVEIKGLEECPECGENWYNPEYNDEFKSCRNSLDFGFSTVDRICTNCGEVWEDQPVHESVDTDHFRNSDCEPDDVKDRGHAYTVCTGCGREWERKSNALQHLYSNDCEQEDLTEKVYG
jgi:hypothetical protein